MMRLLGQKTAPIFSTAGCRTSTRNMMLRSALFNNLVILTKIVTVSVPSSTM
jgi:hypothetical protein